MQENKYAGIDLHQSTCLIAVHDQHGKSKTEAIVETNAETLRDFFAGLSGNIHVAFEVGTQSAWLYEILKSQVSSITVCDVRDKKRKGNKNDRRRPKTGLTARTKLNNERNAAEQVAPAFYNVKK